MLCSVCNEDIFESDDIRCAKCKEYLHFSCASMREATFRKLNKQTKEKWSCAKCKTTIMVSNTDNTRDDDSFVGSNDKLSDLTNSVKFMSTQFDGFGKQLSEVLNSIKELKVEINTLKEKNCKLNNDVKILSEKVNLLEQKEIISNVEIIGVPEKPNENCVEIVEYIASKLNVHLSVVKAFRMQSKISNKPKKIIAEINSVENKKKFMEMMKKSRLNAKNLNENWGEGKIFINNELSSFNRNLFYKARIFAKDNVFKFVWFKDCKVFIKKNENAKACIIRDECDLLKLL